MNFLLTVISFIIGSAVGAGMVYSSINDGTPRARNTEAFKVFIELCSKHTGDNFQYCVDEKIRAFDKHLYGKNNLISQENK